MCDDKSQLTAWMPLQRHAHNLFCGVSPKTLLSLITHYKSEKYTEFVELQGKMLLSQHMSPKYFNYNDCLNTLKCAYLYTKRQRIHKIRLYPGFGPCTVPVFAQNGGFLTPPPPPQHRVVISNHNKMFLLLFVFINEKTQSHQEVEMM